MKINFKSLLEYRKAPQRVIFKDHYYNDKMISLHNKLYPVKDMFESHALRNGVNIKFEDALKSDISKDANPSSISRSIVMTVQDNLTGHTSSAVIDTSKTSYLHQEIGHRILPLSNGETKEITTVSRHEDNLLQHIYRMLETCTDLAKNIK